MSEISGDNGMRQGNAGNGSVNVVQSDLPSGLSDDDDALASRLVEARLDAELLQEFPGQLPTTLKQAYAVQVASFTRWPDRVVGWKVARLTAADQKRFSQERLAGPIFESTVQAVANQSKVVAQVYDGGFAAIEAEIILELGVDIPCDFNVTEQEDLAGLVAKAYCGAEIASSPMPFVIELGAMSIISDMGINVGAIVGPEIPGFASLPADLLAARVTVDGSVVGEANPGAITGTPIDALRFLIDHCVQSGIELCKGTLVSTGMITGVHEVRIGSEARVDYGSLGWFEVGFDPISASSRCR
jgi:2-keto-4-pentenoate hydratase